MYKAVYLLYIYLKVSFYRYLHRDILDIQENIKPYKGCNPNKKGSFTFRFL